MNCLPLIPTLIIGISIISIIIAGFTEGSKKFWSGMLIGFIIGWLTGISLYIYALTMLIE